MNDIIIIDDVINTTYQDKIEEFLLAFDHAWFFQSDITLNDRYLKQLERENPNVTIKKRPGFGSLMYDNEIDKKGHEYHFLAPIMYSACTQAQIPFNELNLIRGFLSPPVDKNKLDRIDKPHVDITTPHLIGLYYVNDSDGDTIIYQETYNPMFNADILPESLTVVRKITPKKGRIVIFNGSHYHSSSQPITNHRCVINFHFL